MTLLLIMFVMGAGGPILDGKGIWATILWPYTFGRAVGIWAVRQDKGPAK